MIIGLYVDIIYGVTAFFSILVYPMIGIYSVGVEFFGSWIITRKSNDELKKQIALVETQRDGFLQKLIELKSSISYAKEIEMVELAQCLYENVRPVTIAQVILKHCTEHEHFFLINAGSSKGVKVDMVVVSNRVLIGKVVAVYPWYSKVVLISDKQSKIASFIGQETVTAIYQGYNDEKEGELIFVSNYDQLVDHELVISSGQGMIYPYGFALGMVRKKKDGKAKVTFFSDMKHIRYCSVVTKNSELIKT